MITGAEALIGQWITDPKVQDRPPLIGISGCQGSGKTTLGRALAQRFGAVHLSLDDLYRTQDQRRSLAHDIHPLCAVRGAPGSHDLDLGRAVIEALSTARPSTQTALPAFDKLADERLPNDQWPVFVGRPTAILIDGWCLGALPIAAPQLALPVNGLEAEEDRQGLWRGWWNGQLSGPYSLWHAHFDKILMLAAPSFDIVLNWRCQQEAGLLGLAPQDLSSERRTAIARFIAHYQRLTEHMLAGGVKIDARQPLDEARRPAGPLQIILR